MTIFLSDMNFDEATKRQLITICLYEDCSLDDKYLAARELQLKNWGSPLPTKISEVLGHGINRYSDSG
jgi:hypothetical protein